VLGRDVGLNEALREELLFWTMLGMRTAASQAHVEWTTMDKERGHGRAIDAVDVDLQKALAEDAAVRHTIDQHRARAGSTSEDSERARLHRLHGCTFCLIFPYVTPILVKKY
jgi:hypothetical protein